MNRYYGLPFITILPFICLFYSESETAMHCNEACAFDPNFWPKLKLILCDNFPVNSQTESQIPAQTLVADFQFLPLLFPLINRLLSILGIEQSTVAASFDKVAVSQRLSATVSLCSTSPRQIERKISRS